MFCIYFGSPGCITATTGERKQLPATFASLPLLAIYFRTARSKRKKKRQPACLVAGAAICMCLILPKLLQQQTNKGRRINFELSNIDCNLHNPSLRHLSAASKLSHCFKQRSWGCFAAAYFATECAQALPKLCRPDPSPNTLKGRQKCDLKVFLKIFGRRNVGFCGFGCVCWPRHCKLCE